MDEPRPTRPPPLRPGDTVAIVAPSSPFDEAKYRAGEAWLRQRYSVVVRDDLLTRAGYLAGDDARRIAELRDALGRDDVRAVIAARGGYGATRIVDAIDWGAFARAPKWIVGFSDVTALHVEASRVGIASMHAPMVASLGAADDAARARWVAFVEGARREDWTGLETIVAGRADGVAFGGNLALIEACAAAGRLAVPRGAILFLEDCTERPYRIDRMLTSLRLGGHLAHVAGVVLGGFTDCNPGPDGVTVEHVLRERLADLGVPVVGNAPFGHGAINEPFVLGATVTIEANAVRF